MGAPALRRSLQLSPPTRAADTASARGALVVPPRCRWAEAGEALLRWRMRSSHPAAAAAAADTVTAGTAIAAATATALCAFRLHDSRTTMSNLQPRQQSTGGGGWGGGGGCGDARAGCSHERKHGARGHHQRTRMQPRKCPGQTHHVAVACRLHKEHAATRTHALNAPRRHPTRMHTMQGILLCKHACMHPAVARATRMQAVQLHGGP